MQNFNSFIIHCYQGGQVQKLKRLQPKTPIPQRPMFRTIKNEKVDAKRLIKRQSANRWREKRQQYVEDLEEDLLSNQEKIRVLRNVVSELNNELNELKDKKLCKCCKKRVNDEHQKHEVISSTSETVDTSKNEIKELTEKGMVDVSCQCSVEEEKIIKRPKEKIKKQKKLLKIAKKKSISIIPSKRLQDEVSYVLGSVSSVDEGIELCHSNRSNNTTITATSLNSPNEILSNIDQSLSPNSSANQLVQQNHHSIMRDTLLNPRKRQQQISDTPVVAHLNYLEMNKIFSGSNSIAELQMNQNKKLRNSQMENPNCDFTMPMTITEYPTLTSTSSLDKTTNEQFPNYPLPDNQLDLIDGNLEQNKNNGNSMKDLFNEPLVNDFDRIDKNSQCFSNEHFLGISNENYTKISSNPFHNEPIGELETDLDIGLETTHMDEVGTSLMNNHHELTEPNFFDNSNYLPNHSDFFNRQSDGDPFGQCQSNNILYSNTDGNNDIFHSDNFDSLQSHNLLPISSNSNNKMNQFHFLPNGNERDNKKMLASSFGFFAFVLLSACFITFSYHNQSGHSNSNLLIRKRRDISHTPHIPSINLLNRNSSQQHNPDCNFNNHSNILNKETSSYSNDTNYLATIAINYLGKYLSLNNFTSNEDKLLFLLLQSNTLPNLRKESTNLEKMSNDDVRLFTDIFYYRIRKIMNRSSKNYISYLTNKTFNVNPTNNGSNLKSLEKKFSVNKKIAKPSILPVDTMQKLNSSTSHITSQTKRRVIKFAKVKSDETAFILPNPENVIIKAPTAFSKKHKPVLKVLLPLQNSYSSDGYLPILKISCTMFDWSIMRIKP
ncbi:hypothetical protein SNEBB_010633 [Seison nebaliae]|nr:hypothetical protein SNEBB_010633 [Seison nebaliae]